MKLSFVTILSLILLGAVLTPEAGAEFNDSINLKSSYDQMYLQKIYPIVKELPGETIRNKLEHFLKGSQLTPEKIYLAKRQLMFRYYSDEETSKVLAICQSTQIFPDDYYFQVLCIKRDTRPIAEKREKVELLFANALSTSKGTIAPGQVAEILLSIYENQNDVASSRIVYKKALEATPIEAKLQILKLKDAIAAIYSMPDNSRKSIEEGIRIYDEVENSYRSDSYYRHWAETAAYNKGVTKAMSLDDYEGAVQEFRKIQPDNSVYTDSRVFLGYSLAKLGKKAESREVLDQIDLSTYDYPIRQGFLRCYESIALFEIGDRKDLGTCVNLHLDTQADVILHVTRDLSGKDLTASIEIALWRQFWKYYKARIIPQMQERADSQIDAMELERARKETELKDLELKNFNLLKIVFGILAVAMALTLWLFLRLQARKDKIEKLQTYIHKSVLSRFLPPILVDEIIQGKSSMESEPREELVTILFADMVGFTALSSKLGAKGSAHVLNRFMQCMTDVIHSHEGTIDKFIGDAVMVIFGAPLILPAAEQARRAIACAHDMLAAMQEMNQSFVNEYKIEIQMRLGINQGFAIVGTFGSEKRSDYTAIGPAVNLASRIEGRAGPNEITLSPEMAKHLDRAELEERGLFALKGIEEEVLLYAVKPKPGSVRIERIPA